MSYIKSFAVCGTAVLVMQPYISVKALSAETSFERRMQNIEDKLDYLISIQKANSSVKTDNIESGSKEYPSIHSTETAWSKATMLLGKWVSKDDGNTIIFGDDNKFDSKTMGAGDYATSTQSGANFELKSKDLKCLYDVEALSDGQIYFRPVGVDRSKNCVRGLFFKAKLF
ncbi:hypothetical protein ACLBXO_05275 [Methylobacterium sp. C33D]